MTTRTWSFWILGLLAFVVGCSKENVLDSDPAGDGGSTVPGAIGNQCSGPDDPACGTNGVCALGYCRIGCLTDGECEQGALCVGDRPPYGCQLPQDIGCSTDNPCTMGLVCGLDGLCRMPCNLSTRCPRNEQQCIEGACYGSAEDGSGQWACSGESKGDFRCDGAQLEVCNVGGLGWMPFASCETTALCESGKAAGQCTPPECSASGDHCDGPVMKLCNADRTAIVEVACDSEALCEKGLPDKTCPGKTCSPGQMRCSGASLQRCNDDLMGWDILDTCETAELCEDSVLVASTNCSEPVCALGDKRCSGSKLEVCNDGRNGWQVDSTCETPELCEDGLTGTGTCAAPTCGVGEKHCNGLDAMVCNAGRTGFEITEVCPYLCDAGECTGVCVPLSTRCVGNVLQTCLADGSWSSGTSCQYICKDTYCTGSCAPGETVCEGKLFRTCDPEGLWNAGTHCSYTCSMNGCNYCPTPGATACDENALRTCGPNNVWSDGAECPFVCLNNGCTGSCKPGDLRCEQAKILFTCGSNGQWDSGEACEFSCINDACTAQCVPGVTRCFDNGSFQSCEAGGLWSLPEACPGGDPCMFDRCSGCTAGCGPLEECHGSLCVAKSVVVPGGYKIDATEVTRSQYETWLATAPATSGQPTYCDWNDSFHPDASCMTNSVVCSGSLCAKHPQVCVDWCDGYAYCRAVGKRMCGKIGGGMNGFDDYVDPSTSQWYAACSSGGVNDYPYGDTYNGATCKGGDAGNHTTVEVGSMGSCQAATSGYAGVFDLSGNVWEWEDSCDGNTGILDVCRARGGGFYYGEFSLRCDVDFSSGVGRDGNGDSFGFRCCSDP